MKKKTYTKPNIRIEKFSFVQTTGVSCGDNLLFGEPNMGSKFTCGWDVGGAVFFLSAEQQCAILVPEDQADSYVCYNNPEDGMNIFSS